MFKNNKYYRIYIKIITSAKTRLQESECYYEKHHIIPKSCGGSDNEDNLVHLTAREHAIVHLLLPKILEDVKHVKSMIYARNIMLNRNKGVVSSRLYESSKKEYIKTISGEQHWAKSVSFKEQVSRQWDQSRRDNFSNSVSGDKHWTKKLSQEANKDRAANMRLGLTTERLREIGMNSTFVTNNPMKNPDIVKQFKKPKEKVICPYCKKEGGKPVMMRYHFDKCKYNNGSPL